ncbi:GumC family protein, partial [Vibrio anguillarum]
MENSLIKNHLNSDEVIDIRQYFHVLLNYKWRILLFSTMVTAIAVLIALSIPSQYTARASLIIESKQAKAVSIEDIYGLDTKSQEYYLTQIEILKSDRVAEEVIKRLNLASHPEFDPTVENNQKTGFKFDVLEWFPVLKSFKKEPAEISQEDQNYRTSRLVLAKFKRGLEVSPIRKTQLVNIFYTSKDPKLSAQIANEIGNVFMDSHIEDKLQVELKANSWLNNRMGDLREQLKKSEVQLQTFLKSEGLVDIQGVESLASQELEELTSQLNKT